MYKKKFKLWGWGKNAKRERPGIKSSAHRANVGKQQVAGSTTPAFRHAEGPLKTAYRSEIEQPSSSQQPSTIGKQEFSDELFQLEVTKTQRSSIGHRSADQLVSRRPGPYSVSIPSRRSGPTPLPQKGRGNIPSPFTVAFHDRQQTSPGLKDRWSSSSDSFSNGYPTPSSSDRSSWVLRTPSRSSTSSHPIPKHISDPVIFELPEVAMQAIREHVCRYLTPLLPKNHVPMTVPVRLEPSENDLELKSPTCIVTMGNSMLSGLQAVSTGKISTSGAFFERAFKQVDAVIRTNFINMIVPVLAVYREAMSCGQSQIGQMLIAQFCRMSIKIQGRNSIHAQWTSCILRMPESMINDVVFLLATSYQNTLSEILGPYNYHSMQTRTYVLQLKSTINAIQAAPEWEQLISDYLSLPSTSERDRLVRDAMVYYGENLIKVLHDYSRAEALLHEMVGWLETATPEQGYGNWGIVAGTELYCRSLAGQGKDLLAESTYRFLIRRTLELVEGEKDHVLVLECKRSYAAFLTDRQRLDEMDQIYSEIDAELAAFMLEQEQ